MGLAISGCDEVELEVEDGKVQLDTVLFRPGMAAAELRELLASEGLDASGAVPVVSLMMALVPVRGSPLTWCLSQMLHYCGLAMDMALRDVSLHEAAPPSCAQTAGARRRGDKDVAMVALRQGTFITGFRKHGKTLLTKYWLAGRRWFGRAGPRNVSCDAARIGGRDLLSACLLAWCGDQYRTMWCPPQVCLSRASFAVFRSCTETPSPKRVP